MSGIVLVMSSSSVDYRNWNNKLSKTANARNTGWHIIFISKCINNNMAPWTINGVSNVIQQTTFTWAYKTNKRGKFMSSYCNILWLLFAYVHFFPRGSRIFLQIFRIPNNCVGCFFSSKSNAFPILYIYYCTIYCCPATHNNSTRLNNTDSDYILHNKWHGRRMFWFCFHNTIHNINILYYYSIFFTISATWLTTTNDAKARNVFWEI